MTQWVMFGCSWSPNSTVFLIFVELAVVTPVERRTFVSVAPATTKSKLGPIFFLQNIFLLYILLVKMQKTGQKTDKNPEKNCFFSSPSGHLAEFHLIWAGPYQVTWYEPDHIRSTCLIWSGPYQVTWYEPARKKQLFSGVLSVFRPVFCIFTNNIYNKKIFWKKIGPNLLFVVAGATDTNVRRSTGVTTANSTNIRNTNQLSWAINEDHTVWLTDFERQIRDFQEDWETWFSIPHLWPFNSHYETASIAMLTLDTNEDSSSHLFRGEECDQLDRVLPREGGFTIAQQ